MLETTALLRPCRRVLWSLNELQESAWNPLYDVNLAGSAIYGLVARDFAPVESRLLNAAIEAARNVVAEHQIWLEEEMLPRANGDLRVGAELYNVKLAYALNSPLNRKEITARAGACTPSG